MRRVIRLNQIEPGRGRGYPPLGAVFGLEHFEGPAGCRFGASHSNQHTGNVAYHMKQERVGTDVDDYQRTSSSYVEGVHPSNR